MIYQDRLITLTDDVIILERYYFPTMKRRVVPLTDIEGITVAEPTVRNGKWRIHGTGNFKTWFPRDPERPRREKIFFVELKGRWVNIGFTVENTAQVERILREKALLRET